VRVKLDWELQMTDRREAATETGRSDSLASWVVRTTCSWKISRDSYYLLRDRIRGPKEERAPAKARSEHGFLRTPSAWKIAGHMQFPEDFSGPLWSASAAGNRCSRPAAPSCSQQARQEPDTNEAAIRMAKVTATTMEIQTMQWKTIQETMRTRKKRTRLALYVL